MDAPDFLADLRARIGQHRALHHPLLDHLAQDADRADFLIFGQQHIHLVGRFTTYLERLLLRAPDSQDKLWLAKVLVDEYGEGSDGQDHATLYRHWLAAMADGGELSVTACPTVQQFVGGHLRLIGEQPFLYGLGMVGPGHEWAIPTMFRPVIAGLERLGMGAAAMRYFPLHCEQDEDHGAWLEEALLRHAHSPEAQRQIAAGAEESLRLRGGLWDGILARINARRAAGEPELVGS